MLITDQHPYEGVHIERFHFSECSTIDIFFFFAYSSAVDSGRGDELSSSCDSDSQSKASVSLYKGDH